MISNSPTKDIKLQICSLRTLMRIGNLSLDLCPCQQRHDILVRYSLYTSEAYLSDIMANLTSFGALIDDLENYDGVISLNLSVPEANMDGFETWLLNCTLE